MTCPLNRTSLLLASLPFVFWACNDSPMTPSLAEPQDFAASLNPVAANCIPASALEGSQQNATAFPRGFYGIQLRRISGTSYEIHISDRTSDPDAFGHIRVIDLATSALVVDQMFGSFGDFNNPGFHDEPLTISVGSFSVLLRSQEFSGSSIFFGDDAVSHFHPPTDFLVSEERCYNSPRFVDIDIKPGSDANSVNPGSRGSIPVAVLSTAEFSAVSDVDATSLTFGRTGNENSLRQRGKAGLPQCGGEDINSDGLADLVCHFDSEAAGFASGDTEGVLKGRTTDGSSLEGRDVLRTVPAT